MLSIRVLHVTHAWQPASQQQPASSRQPASHPCFQRRLAGSYYDPASRRQQQCLLVAVKIMALCCGSRTTRVLLSLLIVWTDSSRINVNCQTLRTQLRPDMNKGPAGAATTGAAGSLTPAGFPGTATRRLQTATGLVSNISDVHLNGDWGLLRSHLLKSCGMSPLLRDRTGHCFDDFNHVDCCTMRSDIVTNENLGRVEGMHHTNQLGGHITRASVETHGPGGSWCTCHIGAGKNPPKDVCHVQFEARCDIGSAK